MKNLLKEVNKIGKHCYNHPNAFKTSKDKGEKDADRILYVNHMDAISRKGRYKNSPTNHLVSLKGKM